MGGGEGELDPSHALPALHMYVCASFVQCDLSDLTGQPSCPPRRERDGQKSTPPPPDLLIWLGPFRISMKPLANLGSEEQVAATSGWIPLYHYPACLPYPLAAFLWPDLLHTLDSTKYFVCRLCSHTPCCPPAPPGALSTEWLTCPDCRCNVTAHIHPHIHTHED